MNGQKSSNFPRLSSLKPNISLPNIFTASFSRKVESDASLLRKSKKISWLCARMSNNCCCSRGDFQISPPTHSSSLLRFSKIGMIILHSFRARNPHTKYLQISSPINANQEPQNHWFYAKKNADGFSANVKTFTQTDWMKNSLHNLSSFCGSWSKIFTTSFLSDTSNIPPYFRKYLENVEQTMAVQYAAGKLEEIILFCCQLYNFRLVEVRNCG